MITPQYKRDLNHNYLILPIGEEAAGGYQLQMITKNKIEGLLACQRKETETGTVCCYEISSKQSLQHLFMTGEINYTELKNLLTGIYLILQRIERYLLDSRCLVLEPEYIYMEADAGNVRLTYLPGYEDGSFIGIKHLAEFILSKVNHKDEQAAELAYYLYQYTKEENFSFRHLAEYIENQNTQSAVSMERNTVECKQKTEDGRTEPKNIYGGKQWENTSVEDLQLKQKNGREYAEQAVQGKNTSWKRILNRLLFLCLTGTIVIIAVSVYLFMNYELTLQEKVIGVGTAAVFYAILVIMGIHYKNRTVKRGRTQWTKGDDTGSTDREEAYLTQSLELQSDYQYTSQNENEETEEEEYGNTVFFGSGAKMRENCLTGECRGNAIRYHIDKTPVTIGKMQDKVDIVLNDTSVSRIHAGIYQKGDKLFLTDLNSTNGTYKNEVILQPGEMAELEAGDELRFGKICLTYH